MAKNAAQAGVSGAKGAGRFGKKLWDALSGAEKKRTEEEAHVQSMIDSLPDMYFEMQKMSKGLKDAEDGIKAVMREAEKVGIARVEMVKELNVYLGAAPEMLRRYNEIYIKEAKEAYDETKDPEDELYLTNVMKARDNFHDQYRILESSRAQGVEAAQRLRMLIDELEKQRKIIQQFSTVRENEWLALLSTAGISASSLKVAAMIKKSDETGDKLHGLATDMMEKAHEMTLESQGRGTVDPAKLLDSLNRMQKMIEDENKVKQKRYLEAEAVREQIRAASEKLLNAVETAKNQRVLEAIPEEKAKPEKPVANDNTNNTVVEEKADPAAPEAPRKKGPAPKP